MINPKDLSGDELYFNDKVYMSVSAYKKFKKCEVHGITEHNYTSTALMVGSYIDRYVEGTLNKFKEEHPEIISSRGTTKGELKSEFKQAEEICRFIDNDKLIQQFLSGEKQVVMTGEIKQIPFKIKMDSYSKDKAIVDLKIMATITNSAGEYIDFITKWGYDIQLACYQEIVRQNTGEILPCYICVLTKESPINSAVIQLPQTILDTALYKVEEDIERFYKVKTGEVEAIGCGVCSDCISNRKVTPLISYEELLSE